jgi:hypothetical protein
LGKLMPLLSEKGNRHGGSVARMERTAKSGTAAPVFRCAPYGLQQRRYPPS